MHGRTTYLDDLSGLASSGVVILLLDVIEDLLQLALQERQHALNEWNDGLQVIFAEHGDQQEGLTWHVSVSVKQNLQWKLTCTKTALMIALPINVAKKNVLNGTNKWPAVRPARSNNGLGTDANNKMPKKPKRPKLLTTNYIIVVVNAWATAMSDTNNYLFQSSHESVTFLFFVQQINFALFQSLFSQSSLKLH